MNKGLVSVIVPTYQGSKVIQRAIESVLNQSYSNIEIIVVDDNNSLSEDRKNTELVMNNYADNSKVTYIKHPHNKNGSAARNTGIRESHGEFIAFLDDDDWFLPEKIKKQFVYLEENKEYAGCYCYARRDGINIKTIPYKGDVTKELLLMKPRMFTPSLFFRKESMLAINGFDETYRRHQDYEMLLRFFRAGYKIGCVEEVLVELGWGGANNAPTPEKMLELKKIFLSNFADAIDTVDKEEPGFKRKTIALHYGSVFQTFIHFRRFREAFKIAYKYFFYSPSNFTLPFRLSLYNNIKRRIHNFG